MKNVNSIFHKNIMLIIIFSICIIIVVYNIRKKVNYDWSYLSKIEMGNFYEHTTNNFVQGIDVELSQNEVENWKNILMNHTSSIKKIDKINKGTFVFELIFYDKDESEVLSLLIDEKYRMYTDDGYLLKNEKAENYFQEQVKKYGK